MDLKYFNPRPTTTEEAQSIYHKLIFQFHPDHNPSPDATRQTQDLNAEYAYILANLARDGAYARQAEAHAQGRKSAADYHDIDNLAEELRIRIEAALNIGTDITVELCGLWIWITGNTKEHRDQIKAIDGFKYSGDKKAWYYAGVPSFNRSKWSLDAIRNAHGSTTFTRQSNHKEDQELAGILAA